MRIRRVSTAGLKLFTGIFALNWRGPGVSYRFHLISILINPEDLSAIYQVSWSVTEAEKAAATETRILTRFNLRIVCYRYSTSNKPWKAQKSAELIPW